MSQTIDNFIQKVKFQNIVCKISAMLALHEGMTCFQRVAKYACCRSATDHRVDL